MNGRRLCNQLHNNVHHGAIWASELLKDGEMGTSSAWTPERRARQSERIRRVKPWEKSTGPRTPDGKFISSQNALKHSLPVSLQWDELRRTAAAEYRHERGWEVG